MGTVGTGLPGFSVSQALQFLRTQPGNPRDGIEGNPLFDHLQRIAALFFFPPSRMALSIAFFPAFFPALFPAF